ncbi:LysR family transcriptional regulator [Falsiphaeobacter marinintestinus]|uniref:LysR family transcriptional regulator n=1 Tax=Falsiphaeobacter marinintestinus TaxID=1492905 RepID=UPI0011B6601C|nr:LysR family transcriptional regulator [Phaeobacter marinintestinus]
MDMPLSLSDWSLIPSFLAVAETGSLSGAARKMGRSQPSLGRDIRLLEASLGVTLFERHARGLTLSDVGTSLLPMAHQMRDTMNALELTAAGRSQDTGGTVRITASVFASHFILPPILARIREEAPEIQLDLMPSDATENLLFHEADIAVRMYRPTQLDIVTRQIVTLNMGVYAARSYLDHKGWPQTPIEMMQHDLVGFDANDLILTRMREQGWPVTRDDFAVRCDDQAAYWHLIRAGCGIGFSQRVVGNADPGVVELDLGVDVGHLEVWLAAHRTMRQTPRIRRVWDLLARELADLDQ